MRVLTSTLILFFQTWYLHGQQPLPFPVQGKWIFQSGGMFSTSDPIVRKVVDTVMVNDLQYFQMGSDETCPLQDADGVDVLIREDSGKWFVLMPDASEFLYADFTLALDDTLNHRHPYYSPDSLQFFVVTDIDTVTFVDDIERRRWRLHPIDVDWGGEDPVWDVFTMEGIGSQYFFDYVYPPGMFDGGWFGTMCFATNGEDAYPVFGGAQCCWTGNVEQGSFAIRCYPNPVIDKLFVELLEADQITTGSWRITDSSGRLVIASDSEQSAKEVEIDLHILHSGYYDFEFVTSFGIHYRTSFTKF